MKVWENTKPQESTFLGVSLSTVYTDIINAVYLHLDYRSYTEGL